MAFRKKLLKEKENPYDLALTYCTIILALEGEHLPKKELELLAFTIVRGKINPFTTKNDFAQMYKSTLFSINNMISRLTRKGYLIKEKNIISPNPSLKLDFTEGFFLNMGVIVKRNKGTDS